MMKTSIVLFRYLILLLLFSFIVIPDATSRTAASAGKDCWTRYFSPTGGITCACWGISLGSSGGLLCSFCNTQRGGEVYCNSDNSCIPYSLPCKWLFAW